MLKELLENIWIVRKQFFCILISLILISFFTFCAQRKGMEKAINYKIERWEKENYHLTEYRKKLIMKECCYNFNNADEIINRLGFQQPNFDRK